MNAFTETPSRDAPSSTRALRPSPRRSVMRADEVALAATVAADVLVLHVGEVHVVAGDADLHPPLRQLGRQFGRGVRQQVEDPSRDGPPQHGGDAFGGLGHRVVAELPHRHDVGAQPVDHQ